MSEKKLIKTVQKQKLKELKKKNKIRLFNSLGLDEVLKLLREYNEEHDTALSYGYFVAYINSGRIEL